MITDSRKNLQFSYNFLNLLGEVKSGSTVKAKYTWLADGSKLRVRDAGTTGFDYLGSLTYTSGSSGLALETAQFAGGVIRSGNSQEINYFITDHLGSVRAIVNSAGTAVEQNDYYAFGAKHVRSTYPKNDNRLDFNGKEEQTTGDLKYLDYGARMYDPAIGRWFNVDPLAEKYYSYSLFHFSGGNPVRFVDPNGAMYGYYYNYDGTFLGTDGIDDDLVFIVTDNSKTDYTTEDLFGFRWDYELGRSNGFLELLSLNHTDFMDLAGTLYAEGTSWGTSFEEASALMSVIKNRASLSGRSLIDIASSTGIFGWNERAKISGDIVHQSSRQNSIKATIWGLTGTYDYSNGAYFWHGRDFGMKSEPAYKNWYEVGFRFTDTSHNRWNLESITSGKSSYDYQFESTAMYGNTTFMRYTDQWRKTSKHPKQWP